MPSHQKIPAYARIPGQPMDEMQLQVIPPGSDAAEFNAQFEQEFLSECLQNDCHTVLLSSEHCQSRLHSTAELLRIKQLLQKLGQIDIIVYLRRQDQLLLSSYATDVRLGSPRALTLPQSPEEKERFRYGKLCDLWADVFGRDQVHVRIFSKQRFRNGDLLEDFLDSAGIEVLDQQLVRPAPENQSIDARLLEFLRHFNKFLPHMGKHTRFMPDPRQGNLLPILDRMSRGDKIRLPSEELERFSQEFESENKYVAETFLHREDGILFDIDDDESKDGNVPVLGVDDAFEIFAEIWAAATARADARRG